MQRYCNQSVYNFQLIFSLIPMNNNFRMNPDLFFSIRNSLVTSNEEILNHFLCRVSSIAFLLMLPYISEAYLKPSQKSTIELFCKNS